MAVRAFACTHSPARMTSTSSLGSWSCWSWSRHRGQRWLSSAVTAIPFGNSNLYELLRMLRVIEQADVELRFKLVLVFPRDTRLIADATHYSEARSITGLHTKRNARSHVRVFSVQIHAGSFE